MVKVVAAAKPLVGAMVEVVGPEGDPLEQDAELEVGVAVDFCPVGDGVGEFAEVAEMDVGGAVAGPDHGGAEDGGGAELWGKVELVQCMVYDWIVDAPFNWGKFEHLAQAAADEVVGIGTHDISGAIVQAGVDHGTCSDCPRKSEPVSLLSDEDVVIVGGQWPEKSGGADVVLAVTHVEFQVSELAFDCEWGFDFCHERCWVLVNVLAKIGIFWEVGGESCHFDDINQVQCCLG